MKHDRAEADPGDGLVLIDENWRCRHANAAAAALFRVEPSEVAGGVLWDLLSNGMDAKTVEEWRRALLSGTAADLRVRLASNGRYYACRSLPWPTGALLCFLDVTEQQTKLRTANEERRRMENFLAVLAHELRNPLSALSQGVALLKRDATEVDRGQCVDMLQRQLQYFVRIVEDLLDVSAIARGRVQIRRERFEVEALIAAAIDGVETLVARKAQRMDVRVPAGTVLEGDFTRLEQVLINLLRNAATYTDTGGTISVAARRIHGEVEIRISDTGRGIAPERLAHLFEPFYDVDGSGSGQARAGIGLGVVRRIVELHGGSVTAHSEGVGRGSEFVIRIPAAAHRGD